MTTPPRLCHCGLHLATVHATVAGIPIELCPACVAHYRAQTWPDGRPIEVITPTTRDDDGIRLTPTPDGGIMPPQPHRRRRT